MPGSSARSADFLTDAGSQPSADPLNDALEEPDFVGGVRLLQFSDDEQAFGYISGPPMGVGQQSIGVGQDESRPRGRVLVDPINQLGHSLVVLAAGDERPALHDLRPGLP